MRAKERVLLGAVVGAFLLSACDPAAVPRDPRVAWVDLDLGYRGDAELTIMVAPEKTGELESLARELQAMDLPAQNAEATVDQNRPGSPFLVVRSSSAYERGPSPEYSVRVSGIYETLEAHSITEMRFLFCVPSVPATANVAPPEPERDGCYEWGPNRSQSVVATVRLNPEPGRWWQFPLVVLVAIVSLILAWTGIRRRERDALFWGALCGALVVGVGPPVLLATSADLFSGWESLGIAGVMEGAALALMVNAWGPVLFAVWLTGIAALGMLVSKMTAGS